MNTTDTTKASLINAYSGASADDVYLAYYGNSKFMNVGYWAPGIVSQDMASRRLLDELLDLTDLQPGEIADVACGLGGTTHHIAKRLPEARITGINITPYQVMRCKENFPELDFRVMDAVNMEFPDDSLDAVISVEAACHFNTRRKFFAECARVLKPGGKLLLSDTIFSREFEPAMHWMSASANNEYTIADYCQAVEDAGFSLTAFRDTTRECWEPFTGHMRRWALTQHFHKRIDDAALKRMLDVAKGTAKLPVLAYVMLAAVKK